MIRISIQPKRENNRRIWGMNSKKKSRRLRKCRLFMPFKTIPRDIWTIAKITASFILKLLVKVRSWSDLNHTGSNPKG